MKPIPTRNEAWGFYGSISHHADPSLAWDKAFEAIAADTACSAEAVRDFLDSRQGRHFADTISDGLLKGQTIAGAVAGAVDQWQRWTTCRRMQREQGIPAGLPLLMGLVTDIEITLQLAG